MKKLFSLFSSRLSDFGMSHLLISFSIFFLFYYRSFSSIILWLDDWGWLPSLYVTNKNFLETLGSRFPLMTFRPLGALVYSVLPYFFIENLNIIFFINFVTYASGLGLLCQFLRRSQILNETKVFFTFCLLPVAASPVLFSPINLMPGNIFLLILSSLLLYNYIKREPTKSKLVVNYLLLTSCFLLYDALFQLLILWFILLLSQKLTLKNVTHVLLPPVGAIFTIIIYQKIITPLIGGMNNSRLDLRNLFNLKQYWLSQKSLFMEVGKSLFSSKTFFFDSKSSLVSSIFLFILLFLLLKTRNDDPKNGRKLFFLILCLLILLPMPFWLSGNFPVTSNYDARIFIGPWICLALIVALLTSLLPRTLYIVSSVTLIYILAVRTQTIMTQFIEIGAKKNSFAEAFLHTNWSHCNAVIFPKAIDDIKGQITLKAFDAPWDSSGFFSSITKGKLVTAIQLEPENFQNRIHIVDKTLIFDQWFSVDFSKNVCFYDFHKRKISNLISPQMVLPHLENGE